jgi:anti-sigma factor RsiW
MECSAAWTVLASEGPLDPGQLEQAGRHMESCAACQARLDRDALPPGSLKRYVSPPELLARVTASLDGVSRAATTARYPWSARHLAALAASMLLGAVLASGAMVHLRGSDAERDVLQQAVSGHIGAQLAGRLTQIASGESHTVKPWFAGRIDAAPPVRDLKAEGFPLQGARIDYLGRRTTAVVVYAIRKHTIDLFITPSPGADRAPRSTTDRGYNVVAWSSGGFEFVAVSDVNPADLMRFQALTANR